MYIYHEKKLKIKFINLFYKINEKEDEKMQLLIILKNIKIPF